MATEIDCKLKPIPATNGPPLRATVFIPEHSIQISLGENASFGDQGNLVVMVENSMGSPKVIIWGDADQKDPTHIISLDKSYRDESADEKKQALAEVVSDAVSSVSQNK
jgi:hypothetical protein